MLHLSYVLYAYYVFYYLHWGCWKTLTTQISITNIRKDSYVVLPHQLIKIYSAIDGHHCTAMMLTAVASWLCISNATGSTWLRWFRCRSPEDWVPIPERGNQVFHGRKKVMNPGFTDVALFSSDSGPALVYRCFQNIYVKMNRNYL